MSERKRIVLLIGAGLIGGRIRPTPLMLDDLSLSIPKTEDKHYYRQFEKKRNRRWTA